MILDQPVLDTLTLTQGAARCVMLPQAGGSIGAWSVAGQDMLRAAGESAVAARDPYATAGFPLVPYSNRIAEGLFEWDGKPIKLTRNFPPEPHAIHGVGFERPWQVAMRSNAAAELTYQHRPDAAWPFAFEARQRVTLDGESLLLELSAVNLEPQSVPLAFGHHPYFPRVGARLTFEARCVWLVGDDGLPNVKVRPSGQYDFSQGLAAEHAEIDHCFTGWNGTARIEWAGKARALEITASPELNNAVVYIRREQESFCFEPVPHINNALNRRDRDAAMPVLASGASFTASVRFQAVKR